MKNIQVIDDAANCVYDIFAATDDEFDIIFREGADVAFIDEVYANGHAEALDAAFRNLWSNRVRKSEARGIHGTLFYGLEHKKAYYPTRKDDEAANPNGSALRPSAVDISR